jgi:hypothetical protein
MVGGKDFGGNCHGIFKVATIAFHVKWVPCHHSTVRPQVVDGGEGLQIWMVAANILNNSRGQPTRGGPQAFLCIRGSYQQLRG